MQQILESKYLWDLLELLAALEERSPHCSRLWFVPQSIKKRFFQENYMKDRKCSNQPTHKGKNSMKIYPINNHFIWIWNLLTSYPPVIWKGDWPSLCWTPFSTSSISFWILQTTSSINPTSAIPFQNISVSSGTRKERLRRKERLAISLQGYIDSPSKSSKLSLSKQPWKPVSKCTLIVLYK